MYVISTTARTDKLRETQHWLAILTHQYKRSYACIWVNSVKSKPPNRGHGREFNIYPVLKDGLLPRPHDRYNYVIWSPV